MAPSASDRFGLVLLAPCVIAVVLGGAWARAGDTQIYKTVDEHGNVVYTDRASSANASKSTVRFHEPSAADLASLAQQQKAAQAAESQRLQQTAASNVAHLQQAKAEKEKQARCDSARDNYNRLQQAGRIYQLDAQGNRVYMPDADAEAARTQARTAMEAACAS